MSSFEQLIVFKEVADTGNITRASRHLHVSQPSVSIQIQNLEKEYGVPLLERTNKGVVLTEYGRFFYGKISTVIQTLNETKETLRILSNQVHNDLHVGMTLTIGNYLLAPIMNLAAQGDRPEPKLNVLIANTRAIAQAIQDRKIHIGLIEGPVESDDDFIIEPFWQDELVIAVSPNHPFKDRAYVSFEELKKESLILREVGSGTRETMNVALHERGFDPDELNVTAEFSSIQAIKEAVGSDHGITIISILAVQDDVMQNRLHILRFSEGPIKRPLDIIRSKSVTLSDEEKWFLELMRSSSLLDSVIPDPFNERHHG